MIELNEKRNSVDSQFESMVCHVREGMMAGSFMLRSRMLSLQSRAEQISHKQILHSDTYSHPTQHPDIWNSPTYIQGKSSAHNYTF